MTDNSSDHTQDGLALSRPSAYTSEELAGLALAELHAELTHVRDRLNHDAASAGFRRLPGQMHRRAALVRREHQLAAELRRRRSEEPEPEVAGTTS